MLHWLLAAASDAPIFVRPLPLWDYWAWLAIPLCAGVAVVYKSIKCRSMGQVPREASVLAVWILLALIASAILLAGLVKLMERV